MLRFYAARRVTNIHTYAVCLRLDVCFVLYALPCQLGVLHPSIHPSTLTHACTHLGVGRVRGCSSNSVSEPGGAAGVRCIMAAAAAPRLYWIHTLTPVHKVYVAHMDGWITTGWQGKA